MASAVQDFLQGRITSKLREAKAITDLAETEGRALTDKETETAEAILEEVGNLKSEKAAIESSENLARTLEHALGPVTVPVEEARPARSIGEAFVNSDSYKAVIDADAIASHQKFSIDVTIPGWQPGRKASETVEGNVVDSTDTVNFPDVRPTILPLPFRRPMVADLFNQATTSSNNVMLPEETVATNAAAQVAELGAKPQSIITFDMITEPVRKTATHLKVSDEILDDVPALQSYLNSRLGLFVALAEETGLISGNGSTPNLNGLTNRSIQTSTAANLGANPADVIFEAMTAVYNISFLEADAIVVNNLDWAGIRLSKDLNNQYYGGGPFTGAYGNPGSANANMDQMWGLQVISTPAIAKGTAIVGAFKTGATLFRKAGLSISATNSDSTDFTHNITTIRAESRVALVVHRTSAFMKITSFDTVIDFS